MLAAFFFWPLLANLGLALHDRSDTLLNTWILGWQAHILVREPWELFNAPIFYPLPNTLALSEVLWPFAPLAVPLLAATGNPVLVYNLLFLASFPLAGLGMYVLAGHLTHDRRAALLASVIYAFCPYQFGHLSQLQLITIGWLPMALLALDRFWARRNARDGVLLAFCVAAQTLSAFYYGFQVVLAIGLYLAVRLARSLRTRLLPRARGAPAGVGQRRILPTSTAGARTGEGPGSRPRSDQGQQKSAWLPVAWWLAVAGLAVLPFALPYFWVHASLGLERSLGEALAASPPLADFLLPHAANPLYRGLLQALHPGSPLSSGYLFLGVIPSALAVAGCLGWTWPGQTGRNPAGTGAAASDRPAARALGPAYWLLLFAINTVLALGPRLKLVAGDAGGMPLPFGWLYQHLPGMTALRAPGRFGMSAFLALSVLAAMGSTHLWRRVARWPGIWGRLAGPALWAVLSGLCLLEYAGGMGPFAVQQLPPLDRPPAVYAWLAHQGPAPIVELPLTSDMANPPVAAPAGPSALPGGEASSAWPDYNLLRYQYFGMIHWQPSADGYSGFVPPAQRQLALAVAGLPAKSSVTTLRRLGVKWIIVHSGLLDSFQPGRAAQLRDLLARAPGLAHRIDFGPDWVYEVMR
jgi:hypothetical protein